MSQLQILHISDLHIKEGQNFDRSRVLEPMLERIRQDMKQRIRPEIVIVTGDIAFQGKEQEYALAKTFLDDLLKALGLKDEQLFIVPGNHDVERNLYSQAWQFPYKNVTEMNDDLQKFLPELLKGMNEYFKFINKNYPHLNAERVNLYPFVNSYKAGCGKTVAITGLNSTWLSRKENESDERKVAIGEYQMIEALKACAQYKSDLRIFCFHHPLNWLWPQDSKRIRKHFNDAIILNGHIHDAMGSFIDDLDGSFYQFLAGSSYLPKEGGSVSTKTQRFQYITIDWENNEILLDFRKFDPEKGQWNLDSDRGDDGKKTFPLVRIKKETVVHISQRVQEDFRFSKYKDYVLQKHRHLEMQGFETKLRVPIEIEQIYVNMRANITACDFDNTMDGRQKFNERITRDQISSLDIKGAFSISHKRHVKDMVILGDPGSGKTTLLKYIAVMICDAKSEEKIGLSSNIIPFYAPLRELKNPDTETFVDFIARVCDFNKRGVTQEMFRQACDNKQSIILLDGLDEVADEALRKKTCTWIDQAREEFVHTQFILTSRLYAYLGKISLSGCVLELVIQDFTPQEVEAFLLRWYESVERAIHSADDEEQWAEKGRTDAQILIKEINAPGSEYIKRLAVNPLLLQNIALIRRDRGAKLPQRRVELYQECMNVLLEKWEDAKGLKVLLSAREARQVLQPLALYLHEKGTKRSAPLDEITGIVKEALENIGKSSLNPKSFLINIRDRSGLFMGHSESEYGFVHHSFQEYLTAEQIRNKNKIDLLIKNYTEKWWREVILLCLALDNPSVIEAFIEKIIRTEPFKTEISIITDAINDSVNKPSEPLVAALNDQTLTSAVKENVIRVLGQIKKDSVINALKNIIAVKDKNLSTPAFDALVNLDAAHGIEKPDISKAPAIIRHAKDESEMVLIPAGNFLYGSREDDKEADTREKPQQSIYVPDFYMDMYPVTNAQYKKFVDETGHRPPDKADYGTPTWKGRAFPPDKADHPVVCVSWEDAMAYAKWAGKRLPSEVEWEKAARGTDGRRYPWGNEFEAKRCNYGGKYKGTTQIDKFESGKSPYGCYDMAGNVWEWCSDWFSDDNNKKKLNDMLKGPDKGNSRVVRGGSWGLSQDVLRCAIRYWVSPVLRNGSRGFRCSR